MPSAVEASRLGRCPIKLLPPANCRGCARHDGLLRDCGPAHGQRLAQQPAAQQRPHRPRARLPRGIWRPGQGLLAAASRTTTPGVQVGGMHHLHRAALAHPQKGHVKIESRPCTGPAPVARTCRTKSAWGLRPGSGECARPWYQVLNDNDLRCLLGQQRALQAQAGIVQRAVVTK